MRAQWQWESFGTESRTPGTAAKDGMDDTAFTIPELMAREITQNSDDAMDVFRRDEFRDEHLPRLTFRFREVVGTEKQDLAHRLNLADLRARSEHIVEPREEDAHVLRDRTCLGTLDNLAKPLRLLYIEEQGAVGLVGDPQGRPKKSRWFNALESLGVSEHSGTATQSGGTYGFGKAAFQLGSNLGLVVAYSHLYSPDDPVTRRLGGYIYQRQHEFTEGTTEQDYSGFAKFGESVQSGGETFSRRVRPFTDERADEWADLLGMARTGLAEGINQYGTTFLLVDPAANPDDLVAALEKYWWPALLSNSLSVMVEDYDGTPRHPRPRKREDLAPFLQSWSIVTGKSDAVRRDQHKQVFNRVRFGSGGNQVSLGTLAAVADLETCFDANARPDDEIHASRVALVRQRKMVVQYAPFFENREPFVDGVLLTSADIEEALAKSEPKEHNLWWLPHGRAIDKASPYQKEVVETLFRRTKDQVRLFRSRIRPEVDEEHLHLERLSKKLGALLRTTGRKGKRQPPKGQQGPVSVHMPQSQITRDRDDHGRLTYKAKVRLELTDDAPDTVDVQFQGSMRVVEDIGRHGDAIAFTYEAVPDEASVDGDTLTVRLATQPCSFVLKSAPVEGPYRVGIDGRVTSLISTTTQSESGDREDDAESEVRDGVGSV